MKYLVSQGHTVFIVSWKNPNASDRGLGMDDYLRLGIRAAIDAVSRIVPERKIHTVGYCIGGTLAVDRRRRATPPKAIGAWRA